MVFPATLSPLTGVFTERRARAAAIGLWGASAVVGVALGPIAGGWLLEPFWWGSIFVFMVPVAAFVAVLAAWRVPPSRDPRTPPVDRRGLVLSAAGMSLIVYAVIQAPARGWASPVRIGVLAAGLAALGALVAAERVTASPMIDVRLFRNLRFTTAAAVAIAFFALLGFTFLVAQYFQVVHDYSPLSTGVRLLPVTASVGASSAIGTRLSVPLGNKVIVVGGGMGLVCTALVWISTVSQGTSYGIIAAQMVVFGIGMAMTQLPATEAIMGAVPAEKGGVASAVNGCTRLFGGTLGVAVIGSVAASLYTSRLTALLPPGLPPAPSPRPAARSAAPRPPRATSPGLAAHPGPRPGTRRGARVPAQPHRRLPGRRRGRRQRRSAGRIPAACPPRRRAPRHRARGQSSTARRRRPGHAGADRYTGAHLHRGGRQPPRPAATSSAAMMRCAVWTSPAPPAATP